MKRDIKILEKFINKPVKSGEFNKISNKEIRALENILIDYKELDKCRDITIMKSNTKFANVIKDSVYFDYVSKEKIKEKIKQLEIQKNQNYVNGIDIAIWNLQELIE